MSRPVGDVWREKDRDEPWRVQCEDCVLGFKLEGQARSFAERYLQSIMQRRAGWAAQTATT